MPERAEAGPVALELVLALDVSGSISTSEFNLQRTGYTDAFASAVVQNAIAAAPGGIAVTLVQWSTGAVQSIGWTLLDGAASANAFAASISSLGRAFSGGTSVQTAITFSTGLLQADNGFEGARNVIDVSGDGTSSASATAAARDAAVALGYTINGLPIGGPESLNTFYATNVIGGPGAFSLPANSFEDFATAIQTKLVIEIGGGPGPGPTPVPEPASLALFGLGLAALGAARRRRRRD
ncbi:DUF1194 domain-containing protein [Falsiroseomonas sp. HC035]|uniref:DUF1194 domain-containing protein n=1 Tax=Falsiroseomonas sp. HC035 TaxID=3390999 RepID=UPI003D318FB7